MAYTKKQNAYGWWDVFHSECGFLGTRQTENEANSFIDDIKEGYRPVVAGGNGAAVGVCE
jgi:hypothetical protein